MKHLIWLSETRIATEKCHLLLQYFGDAHSLWRADVREMEKACPLDWKEKNKLENKSLSRADEILGACHQKGIRLTLVWDEAYSDYLRNIYDPPLLLYSLGTLPDFNSLPTVTIVGQRKATPAGLLAAERLAHQLSQLGLVVVSGMAEGIDSAAHRGALKGPTPTVAVFGTAIDVCYPKFNVNLMRSIQRQGALISEYPPGAATQRSNFPKRNRIMSGLSLGTVVVEADMKSGSRITADLANDQGRQVFAMPGAVDAHTSDGTNDLIKKGAKLVTDAYDIIVDYAPMYGLTLESPAPLPKAGEPRSIRAAFRGNNGRKAAATPAPPPAKTGDAVLDAIERPMHIDEITSASGLDQAQVLARLTLLELEERVRQLPNQIFERIEQTL